jgi:predicted membrane protein DUF2306
MGSPATTGQRPRAIQLKYVIFLLFAAMIVLVWVTRDRFLLQPGSFLRQRYSPIAPLMFLHGIPGALALFLGIFQFSSRLRRRYLQVHRVMGRIYVGCVALAAPAAVIVADDGVGDPSSWMGGGHGDGAVLRADRTNRAASRVDDAELSVRRGVCGCARDHCDSGGG